MSKCNSEKAKYLIPVFLIFAASLIFALDIKYKFIGMAKATRIYFMLLIACLAIEIFIIMLFSDSVKESIYSYKNIILLGSILFWTVISISVSSFICREIINGTSFKDLFIYIAKFPKEFSFYAVIVTVAICILVGVSNISLILHEGFRIKNLMSVIVSGLYIGGTGAVYLISYFLEQRMQADILSVSGIIINSSLFSLRFFLLTELCYFECMFFSTAIMGYVAAKHIPSYDADYIVILGCSINKNGGLLPLLKGRVNKAIRFFWDQERANGKQAKYIPSGGQGSDEIMSEGSAMELYLLSHGAESYEIIPEKKSRDTFENFLFSKKLMEKENPKIVFATTNYHILRSGILARKAGLDAEGIAGDTKWYFWPNGFLREFIGILAMNIKSHIIISCGILIASVLLGILGYFSNFI